MCTFLIKPPWINLKKVHFLMEQPVLMPPACLAPADLFLFIYGPGRHSAQTATRGLFCKVLLLRHAALYKQNSSTFITAPYGLAHSGWKELLRLSIKPLKN